MRWIDRLALIAGVMCIAAGSAQAQQKLKWAHVYETSEPYHTESVWAAAEIKKRTNGKFDIEVFPASTLGKETDINQGLTLGTVDMIISGPSFAARNYPRLGIAYYPFIFRDGDHLIAYSKSPSSRKWSRSSARRPASRSRRTPTTVRATSPRRKRSPTAPA